MTQANTSPGNPEHTKPSYYDQLWALQAIHEQQAAELEESGLLQKTFQVLSRYHQQYLPECQQVRAIVSLNTFHGLSPADPDRSILGIRYYLVKHRDSIATITLAPFTPVAERLGGLVLPHLTEDDLFSYADADTIGNMAEALEMEKAVGFLPDLSRSLETIIAR